MPRSSDLHLSLDVYPDRVRLPVQALRAAGQIDDQAIATVLLGAPRTDQRHLFLYHLLVVKGLREAKVDVDDTVAMAAAMGRRVDFRWSRRRWLDEHNRLSRWVTLKNLAAVGHVYELDFYRERLPEQWAGYLIPNSRRLGMEGLRQRHCVALYDARIATGQCAIAVVFIEHTRWTVELLPTGNPQHPLHARQIRGVLNREPNREERAAVLSMLDLPQDLAPRVPDNGLVARGDRAGSIRVLEDALPVLRGAGVAIVHLRFDGSGDSGMLEDPEFLDADRQAVSVEGLNCTVQRLAHDGRSYPTTVSLKDAIYEAAESYLDSTDVNWYDNDGGYGEFAIDVATGTFTCEINARYTESSCEHFEELSLDPDDRDGTTAQQAA